MSVQKKCLMQKQLPPGLDYLSKTVDFGFEQDNLSRTLSSTIRHTLKTAVATSLFIFCLYVIVSGLMTGKTRVLNHLPPYLLVIFLIIITLWLAALEGLQISVTALGLCDLDDYKDEKPRAYKIHKMFEGANASNKFLAGRQLQVIGLVFIAACLTSFHDLYIWPFTETTNRWVRIFFLEFGFLGAFFVLWIGQLIPQFIARKNPLFFQNIPGLYHIAYLTQKTEGIGLTSPLILLTRVIKEIRLPLSKKERFLHELQTYGYGTLELRKTWKFGLNEATLTHEKSTVFWETVKTYTFCERIGIDEKFPISRRETEAFLYEGVSPDRIIEDVTLTPAHYGRDFLHNYPIKIINLQLSRNSGFFKPKDVIFIKTNFCSDSYPPDKHSADLTEIVHPTLHFVIRLEFEEYDYELLYATVHSRRKGEYENRVEPAERIKLWPQKGPENDVVYVEFEEWYPQITMIYTIEWMCRKCEKALD